MPFSIGGLLRSPSDLAAAARSVLGWTDEAVQVVADLPARVAALVDEAERLVTRVGGTLDRVDAAVDRVDAVVDRVHAEVDRVDGVVDGVERVAGNAEQVVERIIPITGAADAVLESVGTTSAGAQALLDIFTPIVERGAPLLRHFVDEFSVQELQALIRLVDQVPQFTEHMETDIMPVLCKLDQVGPDVHELLDVLKDVRLAIHGLPGFALFRRRGADREDELDEDRDSAG
jgi:ABC-type transporter Mla subunit MlaD